VKDQSHKHEMSAALRGDFQRLRDRGVATVLAPRDEEPHTQAAPAAAPPRTVAASELEPPSAIAGKPEPGREPDAAATSGIGSPEGERPGFLTRLLGR